MKKILAIFLSVLIIFSFSACSNNSQTPNNNSPSVGSTVTGNELSETPTQTPTPPPDGSSEPDTQPTPGDTQDADNAVETNGILIAYFSRAGENYNVGYIEKGNTEIVAEMIAEQTEGTLFHIQTVNPYPESYEECTDVALKEKDENARPELTSSVDNMDDYDVIFLGYPNWWGDMPMAVYTFLESHDFSGKTIIPFCTHEGSGLANTVKSISTTCSGAEVKSGLSIRGKVAQESQDNAREDVTSWLTELGY